MLKLRPTALLALAALLLATATPALAQAQCQFTNATADFTAGQHFDAGQIEISSDSSQICVIYRTQDDWRLKVTHLAFGFALSDLPQTKKGNPKPGQFAYSTNHSAYVSEYTYCVPFANPGIAPVYIAAHAEVVRIDEGSGQVVQGETAWGGDQDFPGANWATYILYEPECIEID